MSVDEHASPTDVAEEVTDGPAPTDVAAGTRDLTERQTKTLLRFLRVAYPHPSFPDAPFERTAKTVQEAGATDSVLADGIDDLDRRADGDFATLDDEAATAVIEQIAETPFFRSVHATVVVALYDDHEVWDLLGYEGAAFDKGGYLHRGFDDLDWLPDPRIEEYDGDPRVEYVESTTQTAPEDGVTA